MADTVLAPLRTGGQCDVQIEVLQHAIRATTDDVPHWPEVHGRAVAAMYGPVVAHVAYYARTAYGRAVVTSLFVPLPVADS